MDSVRRLLVVCIGNICRSPAAYGFFKSIIDIRQLSCEINSAGLDAMVDHPADAHVQAIIQEEYAIDLSLHRAKQLTDAMVAESDLILVMDMDQQRYLEKRYPFACGKIHQLGKWRKTSIRDPYNQSREIFVQNVALIQLCVDDWAQKLWMAA